MNFVAHLGWPGLFRESRTASYMVANKGGDEFLCLNVM